MLDDDLDYWGQLFDEMEEGRFDSADFVDEEMLKNMMSGGKEYLGGDKSHTSTSSNSSNNKK